MGILDFMRRAGLDIIQASMKTASIVSIGNELLSGQIVGTNAAYLSEKLLSVGIPVVSSYTVGDKIDSIVKSLRYADSDADIILVTGGLGPTDDDVTRSAFAKYLNVELELRDKLLREIESFFAKRGSQMSQSNTVQAYIPAGAVALANNLGTAPGIMAQHKGKLFVALPGVPSEMKHMFEDSVFGRLEKLATGQIVRVRKLKCFGAGESKIAEILGDLMRRDRNPLINCTVKCGVITLTIVATAGEKACAEEMIEKDVQQLYELLGDFVYGTDEQTLAQVVGEKLARQNKTIAVAESCTGGMLAEMLTDEPGASGYFTHGWVTYSNQAKITELAVPVELIENYGAVSEQVAEAMAKGAREKGQTDFAIAITGIAGPTGGSEQKPVGLVHISVVSGSVCRTGRFVFFHDRQAIRLRAAQTALNMLRLEL